MFNSLELIKSVSDTSPPEFKIRITLLDGTYHDFTGKDQREVLEQAFNLVPELNVSQLKYIAIIGGVDLEDLLVNQHFKDLASRLMGQTIAIPSLIEKRFDDPIKQSFMQLFQELGVTFLDQSSNNEKKPNRSSMFQAPGMPPTTENCSSKCSNSL